MKKFILSLLILICLSCNIHISAFAATTNVFKEGVYTISESNFSEDKSYTAQNISTKDGIYLLIFSENLIGLQYIRLSPNSEKYNLVPLKPNYKIVILGNGELFIS